MRQITRGLTPNMQGDITINYIVITIAPMWLDKLFDTNYLQK